MGKIPKILNLSVKQYKWGCFFPNMKLQNYCSLISLGLVIHVFSQHKQKEDKIIFQIQSLTCFHSCGNDERGGEQSQSEWDTASGWLWPLDSSLSHTGSLSLGSTSRSFPARIVDVSALLIHPSSYFPQISLTQEAGKKKMP